MIPVQVSLEDIKMLQNRGRVCVLAALFVAIAAILMTTGTILRYGSVGEFPNGFYTVMFCLALGLAACGYEIVCRRRLLRSLLRFEPVSDKDVKAAIERIAAIARQERDPSTCPFLIIRSCGHQHREQIMDILRQNGIVPEAYGWVPWPECFRLLQCWPPDPNQVGFILALAKAVEALEPDLAEVLLLRQSTSPRQLAELKQAIRRAIPMWQLPIWVGNQQYALWFNVVHVPDPNDLPREWKIVAHFWRLS